MRILLLLLALPPFALGMAAFFLSTKPVGEIQGFLLLLISAVLVAGAAVVDSIISLRKVLEEVRDNAAADAATARIDSLRAKAGQREMLSAGSTTRH